MAPQFREAFLGEVSGVGGSLMRARPQGVAKIEVPIAPLAEQRRIVARIEALFGAIRDARKDLDRTLVLAERFRERQLAEAFEAAIPATDLATPDGEPSGYAPPSHFEGLPELPAGWHWAEMASIASVTGGLTKNQRRQDLPLRIPYLRVANVYADELRLDEIETIGVTPAEKDRCALLPGDLLIVEGNGSIEQIGRAAIWDGSIPDCGHQNHLIRVRTNSGLPPRYLLLWLMSTHGRRVLEALASSSSGLHTLSISKVSAVPVPVPPPGEAEAIVRRIDEADAKVTDTKSEVRRARSLLDGLERRILDTAFRGDLVPQDAADEPAEETLARLRQEAEAPAAPRSRQRRRAA